MPNFSEVPIGLTYVKARDLFENNVSFEIVGGREVTNKFDQDAIEFEVILYSNLNVPDEKTGRTKEYFEGNTYIMSLARTPFRANLLKITAKDGPIVNVKLVYKDKGFAFTEGSKPENKKNEPF